VDPDGERSAGSRHGAITATVVAQLPSALYRVRLEGGREIVAHIADRMDRNFVRILVGDRVRVEVAPADATRGRIVEKL
jgi:translation initiation factor IF-1